MIAIIDYGMGNLASVQNAFAKLGWKSFTTSDPDEIAEAERVVLPGVGAFADAMKNLRQRGIDSSLYELERRKTPLLGICLGMQLLFSESEENGLHKGLDLIPGRVKRFQIPYKVPHMGWNDILVKPGKRILSGVSDNSYFYFVHSYYVLPDDPDVIAATCHYGHEFSCAVEREHLFATQFHPEKSGTTGLRILKNFGEMSL